MTKNKMKRYSLWVVQIIVWFLFIALVLDSIKDASNINVINTSIALLALAWLGMWSCPWVRMICSTCGKHGMCKNCENCEEC